MIPNVEELPWSFKTVQIIFSIMPNTWLKVTDITTLVNSSVTCKLAKLWSWKRDNISSINSGTLGLQENPLS